LTPSLAETLRSPAMRSGEFAVGVQSVVQQQSITLKLFRPCATSIFIKAFLIPMKLERSSSL
jgi:hypothetical protein